jgi:hypothetical protein
MLNNEKEIGTSSKCFAALDHEVVALILCFTFRNFVARPINVLLSGKNDNTILVEKPEAKKPVGRPNIATL